MTRHLNHKWEMVPSIAIAFPDIAAAGARKYYIVIAPMPDGNPILIAADLDEATAKHIVRVHNESIGQHPLTQPDSIPAEWIRVAALAVYEKARELGNRDATDEWDVAQERYRNAAIAYATAAATILRPLIEAETRERCAQMADDERELDTLLHLNDAADAAAAIASAIREEGKMARERRRAKMWDAIRTQGE